MNKGGTSTKLTLQVLNSITAHSSRLAKLLAVFDDEKDNRECIEMVSKHVLPMNT